MVLKDVFIIGAKRTPFCCYGGSLRDAKASGIFAAAAKDAMHFANLDPTAIDSTVVGNINFLSQCDGGKTPRYCGIYSGVPLERPALGVNKACGTGLQAIITGAVDIITGCAKICLVGGTEVMSSLPLLVRNVRFGTRLGAVYQLEDQLKMLHNHYGLNEVMLAEVAAKKYNLQREYVDEFTLQSHLKWKSATTAKVFDEEITFLTLNVNSETIVKDEIHGPNVNIEKLSTIPPLLDDGYIVTSGNSSVPADGAAALILSDEESIKRHKLTPMARLTAWAFVGVDPVGPSLAAVSAVLKLLEASNKKIQEVELFEINETFASQAIATIKELKIDPSKVNVNGGALSMGHPTAATGARMATHLTHRIRRKKARTAIAASSCGGGQGVAVMLESV